MMNTLNLGFCSHKHSSTHIICGTCLSFHLHLIGEQMRIILEVVTQHV